MDSPPCTTAGFRLSLAVVLGFCLPAAVTGQGAEEYALKAAVIYNITKFVEWPPEAFTSPSDRITICVLGENPFGDALNQAVTGKAHDGRMFAVRKVPDASAVNGCQILFVSSSERARFRTILESVPSRGTLTIGDTEGFASQGGIVNLKVESGKIRIRINVGVAEQQKLRISSRLLGLAEIVKSGAGR